MAAAVALAVLAVVRPAPASDPEAAFARGTMIFGLQVGGGAASNIEDHRTISDISFVNVSPRVSYLLFSPFGSGLLRSVVEPGVEGWFQYYLSPNEATAEGLKLAECGLSLPAHLERTHLQPESGLQLRHRDRWRFVPFQVRAS
jgi:hypothetical protein